MNTQTDIESKLKSIFKKVLDIKESEIVPGAKLDESLDIDSTEMVEISVVIKKELGIPLKDNELKKTHSFNEIVGILKAKTG
jgi:acyl carrier protein